MTTPEFKFDEATHTYTLGGVRLPGVTRVLENALHEMEGIPEHLLSAAGEFGKHVDAACHLHDMGDLNYDDLDTRLKPYVDAYLRFLRESGATVMATKQRVYHPYRGYAGEIDKLILFARAKKTPCVVDIKTSHLLPLSVGPQTAAYREAYCAQRNACGPVRYSLHLKPDGTYSLDRYTDPSDLAVFFSCLNIWRFKYGR